jgi:hypothetical protein
LVIVLRGPAEYNEDGVAGEAITPGALVSGVSTLVNHATAAGFAARAFACEREEMGKGIDTNYAVGDTVKVAVLPPGSRVNAILASGQTVAEGAFLESNGNGQLRVYAAGVRIARALEAVTTTGAAARIRAEVV